MQVLSIAPNLLDAYRQEEDRKGEKGERVNEFLSSFTKTFAFRIQKVPRNEKI